MGAHVGVLDLYGVLAESCELRGVRTKPDPYVNGRHNKDNEPYMPHWDVPLSFEESKEAETND